MPEKGKKIGTLEEYDRGFLGKLGDFIAREWEAIKSPEAWLQGFKDVGETALGVGETATAVASGVPGFLAGLAGQAGAGVYDIWKTGGREIVGPAELAATFGKHEDIKERVANLLSYVPKTEHGRHYTRIAMVPIETYQTGVNALAEFTSDDPNTQAGVRFAGDIALVFGIPALKSYLKSNITNKRTANIDTMNRMVQQSKEVPPEVKSMMEEYTVDKDVVVWEGKQPGWKSIQEAAREQLEIHEQAGNKYQAQARAQINELRKPLIEKAGEKAKIPAMEVPQELPGDVAVALAEKHLALPTKPEGKVRGGGLAEGMELPKYAENINLERVGGDYEAKKLILDVSDAYYDLIEQKRMRGISHEDTMALADSLGISSDSLVTATQTKTVKLSAYITAARDVLVTSANRLLELAKEYKQNPTEVNKGKFDQAYQQHAAWQADVGGSSSEIGRALGAHRIQSRDKGVITSKLWEQVMRRAGKKGLTDEQINRLALLDPSDPYAINKFLREIAEVRFGDKLYEAWINSLLFSLQTNVVNATSNIWMMFDKIATTATAAAIESPKALTGKKRRVYWGEAPATVRGMWHGLRVGSERLAFAFANEMTMRTGSKIEMRVPTAIKGVKGRFVRAPGTLLIGVDEFAKGVIETADIYAKAYRKAAKEGKKGQINISTRVNEIINNLEKYPEIQKGAIEEALRRTFQEEYGKYGEKIAGIRTNIPGMRWIVPFLKVSINIPKQAFYRSPMNFGRILWKVYKGEMKGAELSENIGQATMGTATAMAVFMHAKEGNITGGAPKNPAEREAFLRTKQEYSIKFGNTWISLERLEPAGTIIGMVADFAQAWEYMNEAEQTKATQSMASMFTENLINKTFMRGVWTASKAIADPDRYGEYFLQSFAGSVIPTEVAKVARYIDPYKREVTSMLEHIQSRIPGLRQELEPRLDVFGRKQQDEGPLAYRIMSPFWMKQDKSEDMLERELDRLGTYIGPMGKKIGEEKMEPSDYTQMVLSAGPQMRQILLGFISQPEYANMSDAARKQTIDTIVQQVRQSGRMKYRVEYMRK